jgi:hypothetical protein
LGGALTGAGVAYFMLAPQKNRRGKSNSISWPSYAAPLVAMVFSVLIIASLP